MIRDPFGLAGLICGCAALAFWLEARFAWASKLGAALLVILFGALLSNLGLVPPASPVYEGVFGPVTSLAIVWLLFGVRLGDLRRAGPRTLLAFGLAVGATAVGATAASLWLSGSFGSEAWKLAGVMTGTYSGGSLNFVSVGRELSLPPALFSAAAAADNVVTAVWMGATLLLPLWLGRFWRTPIEAPGPKGAPAAPESDDAPEAAPPFRHVFGAGRLAILDIAALLTLGFLILRLAAWLAAAIPAVPEVLWLTSLALLVAQLRFVRWLSGSLQLGYLFLHLFFAVIGINSRLAEIVAVGPEVLYLTVLVVAIHGSLTYAGAWVARLDVGTASVASQAAVGGPSTALALAVSRGWGHLALPGVAVGLLGYAAGTYAGLGVAHLVRALLGG